MRHRSLILFLASVIAVAGLFGTGYDGARTVQAAPANSWSLCSLKYGPAGGFQSKTCTQYTMTREHRTPTGHWWHQVVVSSQFRQQVTYPTFAPPAPVYALPGCPPAIAQWAPYIITASRTTGVSIRAITGIIAIESGGNAQAYNPASGASGLGQFLPSTAAALGVNPWEPSSAILGIARYYATAGAAAYSGGGYGDALIYSRGCD